MSTKYFLPCSCGRKHPVELFQAGDRLTCACGADLEIPRLLELKNLEIVPEKSDNPPSKKAWGVGHGLVLMSAILLLLIGVITFKLISSSPTDFASLMAPEKIRERTSQMTPLETWRTWLQIQKNDLNLGKFQMERISEGAMSNYHMILTFVGIVAFIDLLILIAGIILILRRPPSPGMD